MSAALGIGSRVWVQWRHDSVVRPGAPDVRCRFGVIFDGPFEPGEYFTRSGGTVVIEARGWGVEFPSGERATISEWMLTPIDDGDPVEVEREEAVEA